MVSVYPTERLLLRIAWNAKLHIDTALPFGLRSAPKFLIVGRCNSMDAGASAYRGTSLFGRLPTLQCSRIPGVQLHMQLRKQCKVCVQGWGFTILIIRQKAQNVGLRLGNWVGLWVRHIAPSSWESVHAQEGNCTPWLVSSSMRAAWWDQGQHFCDSWSSWQRWQSKPTTTSESIKASSLTYSGGHATCHPRRVSAWWQGHLAIMMQQLHQMFLATGDGAFSSAPLIRGKLRGKMSGPV